MTSIESLIFCIDNEDDSALPALADALEEEGDPRANNLRKIIALGKTPLPDYALHHDVWSKVYIWLDSGYEVRYNKNFSNHIVSDLYVHLRMDSDSYDKVYTESYAKNNCPSRRWKGVYFIKRSDAFLSLAEAIGDEEL